ncbi:ABC transporter ATP-binding protein [Methanosarcina barkeri]|uniref:ABC transporter, ATP-binding protein n=1 Tax=Methanosarcina barkeri 227 TaxID=1434106 RepID=A0A0E3R7J3_METBA|nr:ABC transporter, ATP-binding protein [Methanosarcina barkeri 227]
MNIIKNSLPEGGFPIVGVSNVRKSYVIGSLEIPVLSDIDLKLERGELLDIMSSSGSGNSTLVNLIDCLDRPTEGQALVRGRDLNRMSDQELAILKGLEIDFSIRTFNSVPLLTAFENVLLPTFANMRINIDPTKRARELFKVMEIQNRVNHRPRKLSGGQSQRRSIVPLINDPTILLADEPTGNLDSRTGS